MISLLSGRVSFFKTQDMSFGVLSAVGRPWWRFLLKGLELSVWLGVSERVFLIFRERREDFLHPRASVKSSVLGFLPGGSCAWWQRCAIRGSSFELSGSVIFR